MAHLGHTHTMDMGDGGSMSGMDMSTGMNNGTMPPMDMGGMIMYLHWSASEPMVLFQNWAFMTPGQYGGFCIAIILVCIFKEFLFAWRTYRLRPKVTAVSITSESFVPSEQLERQPVAGANRNVRVLKQTLSNRIVGSILYAVNLFLGYMIMLLIMVYNWGFIFCIIFGSAFGHFAFSWWLAPEFTEHVEADCCEK